MAIFRCQHLHQPRGWLSPGTLYVADDGLIERVEPGEPDADRSDDTVVELAGWVIPGMANVHSHAFQRALVGLTEYRSGEREDSFWTWRVAMYRLALALGPDDLEAIAAQLYVEMLEAGMTAVGEFHYLHHGPDGTPYRDRAEMSRRINRAAMTAGIGLTHLPVLYMKGGFAAAPGAEQRRFVHHSVDDFFALVDAIAVPRSRNGLVRLGIAPHSLRAVPGPALLEAMTILRARDDQAPIHIHIAEQEREVEEALAHLGARPVRWLLDRIASADLPGRDDRVCFIHATHLDDREVVDLARSNVIAGLCPTTEANLGDGIFRAVEFLAAGGELAIGSDSHVTVSAAGELCALEYSQRLQHRRRNLLCGDEELHTGRFLFDHAALWGGHALDQPIGTLVPGNRADLVVLDADHLRFSGHGPDSVLDAWIFGAASSAVREVYVAGELRVCDGKHVDGEVIARAFRAAIARLQHSGGAS